jgi:DNA polymerase elongation subunit (family B)
MAEIEWFCIDTRIRDQNNKCVVYHFSRTLEDDSIIVQDDSFKPYIIITSPFQDTSYEKLRERILTLWNENKKTKIYLEEQEYERLQEKVQCLKASFESVEDYFYCKRIINEAPEKFHELFSRTTLKKKYFIERGLTPLTVWKCDATAFPMNARVKAYQTSKVEQQDNMTYNNPKIMSLTFQTNNMISSFIYDEEPIRTSTYTTESGSRTITWTKTRGAHQGLSYVESEIDLLDRIKRIISAEKPTIIAGYDSDSIIYPRLIARADHYAETQPSARLNISDDFSSPYASRFGISIHGFVHIDTKTAAENLSILEDYSHFQSILETNHITAGEGLLSHEGQTEKEQTYTKLVRDAATTLYPFLAELSKMVCESLFDVSRFNNARSFQSYYETECLRNKYYPEELVLDNEPYTIPLSKEESWFESHTLKPTMIVSLPHFAAEISIQKNIGKETYNCKCCKPEEKDRRDWYCKKNNSYIGGILKKIILEHKKYDDHKKRIDAQINTPVFARTACASFIIRGYERALQTRSGPLYFPQGAEEIEKTFRLITKKIREKNMHLVSRIENKLLFENISENSESLLKEIIKEYSGDEGIIKKQELIGSIIVKDDNNNLSAAILTKEYEIRYLGRRIDSAGLCNYAKNARDIIVQKIIETKSKDDIQSMIVNKIKELYEKDYDNTELIIFTTLYQPIENYERETLFVKAGRKLQEKGYSINVRTKIPYIATKDGDEIDAIVPLQNEDVETADIALEHYARRQLLRGISPYLKTLYFTKEEIKIILDAGRAKANK